jgi:UDP-GlcNAc:undecaprenyl-phosphate/decaprenyl-phosphate GlcNAc-1-phosphate transferase
LNQYGFLAGLGAAVALTPLIRILARHLGFVDVPRPDRHHRLPTPYMGGVAVYLALLLGLLATGGFPSRHNDPGYKDALALLVGAASLLLGLADDWRPLSPPVKFAGQVAIAVVFVALAGPGPTSFPPLDTFLGLFWMVGCMNAFNFLDNMDGVLSGVAFVGALGMAGLAALHGVTGMGWLVVLAGALLGFLVYNAPPARIFLGDTGSLLLGGLLAAGGWLFASDTGELTAWAALPLVLSYPLFDIFFVTSTRLRRGQAPWIGGRDHTTHRLNTWLGGPWRVLLVVYGLSFLGSLAAIGAGFSNDLLLLLPYWWIALVYFGLGLRLSMVKVS